MNRRGFLASLMVAPLAGLVAACGYELVWCREAIFIGCHPRGWMMYKPGKIVWRLESKNAITAITAIMRSPVKSVTSVKYVDSDGIPRELFNT